MTSSTFALFRFKTIEGILMYWRPSDTETSLYSNGTVKARLSFDINSEKVQLYINNELKETLGFKYITDTLKKYNLYEIKSIKDIHSSALVHMDFTFI